MARSGADSAMHDVWHSEHAGGVVHGGRGCEIGPLPPDESFERSDQAEGLGSCGGDFGVVAERDGGAHRDAEFGAICLLGHLREAGGSGVAGASMGETSLGRKHLWWVLFPESFRLIGMAPAFDHRLCGGTAKCTGWHHGPPKEPGSYWCDPYSTFGPNKCERVGKYCCPTYGTTELGYSGLHTVPAARAMRARDIMSRGGPGACPSPETIIERNTAHDFKWHAYDTANNGELWSLVLEFLGSRCLCGRMGCYTDLCSADRVRRPICRACYLGAKGSGRPCCRGRRGGDRGSNSGPSGSQNLPIH